jgi:hypothetical protein
MAGVIDMYAGSGDNLCGFAQGRDGEDRHTEIAKASFEAS